MPRKEIIINSFNPHKVIRLLSQELKAKINDTHAELRIDVPKAFGTGHIGGIDFKDGLGILFFNCELKKDLALRYVTTEHQPLRLIFCQENDLTHIIREDRMHYQLNGLLGSMVSGSLLNEQVFLLPANKKVCYISIEIDRKKYLPKIAKAVLTLPEELREVFHDIECQRPFLYQGMYSLTIAECIQNINFTEHQGLVRRAYLESKVLEILAMQVKQYLDDQAPSKLQTILRKRDMELIIEARKIIVSNLENPPTISELARQIGTNENKLKSGFRKLYSSSIYQFLQDKRMEKAKLLIAEDKYPVKEIAKLVGYKHAGHFTSKFKDKFGMLPKDYLKSLKS